MIERLYKYFTTNPYISIDTRKINKGDIYFALKGDNFNGNLFAKEALKKGARYVVIDEGEALNNKFIKVDDVLSFLQTFANHHRKSLTIPVIGITGTNGKTTSKELLAQVLSSHYNCYYTQGNLNNHIGVPLSILNIRNDCEIAIIEMGANHIGEIKALSEIAEPTHGIITNIGKAHLEGFGSVDTIIKTKTELYRFIESIEGTIFYNSQDPILDKQASIIQCNKISFNNLESNVRLISYDSNPLLSCIIKINGETVTISTQLFGEYNAINVLMASSIASELKVPTTKIIKSLESYTPTNNRSQVVKTNKGNTLILDAYNANPSSLSIAVSSFINSNIDNKVIIIGDMLELGQVSYQEHKSILELIGSKFRVIAVGSEFYNLKNDFLHVEFYPDSKTLKQVLKNFPIENCGVLIKGSRAIGLEVLREDL